MASFARLWAAHVGLDYLCDEKVFANQCAMRMGKALEDCGIRLTSYSLKRCTTYDRNKFESHKPGHIRSAQQLANVFYRNPKLLGAGVKKKIMDGTIDDNIGSFRGKQGMVFIMNGWGSTDHIDVWDGNLLKLKGSPATDAYRKVGKQVWLWAL